MGFTAYYLHSIELMLHCYKQRTSPIGASNLPVSLVSCK